MSDRSTAGYWEGMTSRRLTRRRALAGGGAAITAAAFLAACGGNSDKDSGGGVKDASGLLTKPVDSSKQAKSGGTYKDYVNADARTLDPHIREITVAYHGAAAYQTLVRQRSTLLEPVVRGEVEPDFASSWEFSPDKLQATFKIQPDAKWDPRSPTNGRQIEASDVVFTFQRYGQVGTLRSDLVNAVNPVAPIISMSAPDSKTLVMKLASPYADLLPVLRWSTAGSMAILPKEADGGFDPRTDMRGSGPFYLSEYVPSTRFNYTRNPGYFDKNQPYLGKIEVPIISEYATQLAQFTAGSIYHLSVRSEDVVRVKREQPALQMVLSDRNSRNSHMFFGYQDGTKSPFRDERLRQAFVTSLDREAWIDAFYNVQKFRTEGLPMETAWDTCLANDAGGWWLDPQGKDFGPNSKYFKFDQAEAKKLLSAAGFPNGIDVECPCLTTPQYGATFPKEIEVMLGMALDVGIRAKITPLDFVTEWRPKVADTKGNFPGVSFILGGGTGYRSQMFATFNSRGSLFRGFNPDGKSTFSGDPYLEDLTTKMVAEFDEKKAQAMVHDIQRYDAKKLYAPYFPGGSNLLYLGWPALANFGTFRIGATGGVYRDLNSSWIDDTKEPIKKS